MIAFQIVSDIVIDFWYFRNVEFFDLSRVKILLEFGPSFKNYNQGLR